MNDRFIQLRHLKYYGIVRKVYANLFDVALQMIMGKKLIYVKFYSKNQGQERNEGFCTRSCVRELTILIVNKRIDPKLLYFNSDGKLYYDKYEIIQDTPGSTSLSACGFIKDQDFWYYPPFNVKFKHASTFLVDTFYAKYYDVDVKDREVVDVGANIGDTALYFALNGAKYVYAFEPLPNVYEAAIDNVRLNGLQNKIKLINAGVSSKDGEISVPSYVEDSGSYIVNNKGDVRVPLYSIERVRRMVKDPYLLKMDCEGCEADIILNTNLDFERIIFESHPAITRVPHKALVKRLEDYGYKCEFKGKITKGFGMIYCIKNK